VELALVFVDDRAEVAQGSEVTIDGPRTEGAASGHGHAGLPATSEERTHDDEAGAHLADEAVGGVARPDATCVEVQLVTAPLGIDAYVAQDLLGDQDVREARHVLEDYRFVGEQRGEDEVER